jgi:hypothetical protein
VARDRGGGANYQRRSSGAISTIAGVEVEGGGLGKLPGIEEKLQWGLAGAGVRRVRGSARSSARWSKWAVSLGLRWQP